MYTFTTSDPKRPVMSSSLSKVNLFFGSKFRKFMLTVISALFRLRGLFSQVDQQKPATSSQCISNTYVCTFIHEKYEAGFYIDIKYLCKSCKLDRIDFVNCTRRFSFLEIVQKRLLHVVEIENFKK
jgi:hypothetical protein